MQLLTQLDFGRRNHTGIQRFRQGGHTDLFGEPAVVFECAAERGVARDITSEPKLLGIEALRQGDRGAFRLGSRGFQFKVLSHDFLAPGVHHSSRRAHVFIGESGNVLLKEIDESSFPLEGIEQEQARGVHAFRRGCFLRCPGGGKGIQSGAYLIGKPRIKEQPYRYFKPSQE